MNSQVTVDGGNGNFEIEELLRWRIYMSFWEKFNTKWEREQLGKFSSVFRIMYLLLPLIIYFTVGDIIEVIIWTALNHFLEGASMEVMSFLTDHAQSVQGIIYALGTIACIFVVFKSVKNEITPDILPRKGMKDNAIDMISVFFISLVVAVAVNYIFMISGFSSSSSSYNNIYKAQFGVDFIVGIVLYGLVSPIAEEMIFRGIIYNRLKRMFSLYLSVALQAILFGLFHGNIIQGVYGFLMGILIGAIYEKYKGFWAPVLAHMVANVSIYVLSYTIWK